jgi:dynein heavy chain
MGANIVSIDKLDFDFIIVQKIVTDITDYAKDGAFVSGLILEGASWNEDKMHLCEPTVMELERPMPVIHFKPTIKKKNVPPNVYECPMYYYPNRQGTVDRESFIMKVELKCGDIMSTPPSFWIKRGAAILLSTAH